MSGFRPWCSDQEFIEWIRRGILTTNPWKWPMLSLFGTVIVLTWVAVGFLWLEEIWLTQNAPENDSEHGRQIGFVFVSCVVLVLHINLGWLFEAFAGRDRSERMLLKYLNELTALFTPILPVDEMEIEDIRSRVTNSDPRRYRRRAILCVVVFLTLIALERSSDAIANAYGIDPQSSFWSGLSMGYRLGGLGWCQTSLWLQIAFWDDRTEQLLLKYHDLCRDGHGAVDDWKSLRTNTAVVGNGRDDM